MSDKSCSSINDCKSCLRRFCSFIRAQGNPIYQCVDEQFSGLISRFITPGEEGACDALESSSAVVATHINVAAGESGWLIVGAISLFIIAIILSFSAAYWVFQCQRKRKDSGDFSITMENFQRQEEEIPQYDLDGFHHLHNHLPANPPAGRVEQAAEQRNVDEVPVQAPDDDEEGVVAGYVEEDEDDDDDDEWVPPSPPSDDPQPPPSPRRSVRHRVVTNRFVARFHRTSHD